MQTERPLLAVDPGHTKSGIAVISGSGEVLYHDIIPSSMLGETVDVIARSHNATTILVGDGTTAEQAIVQIAQFCSRDRIVCVPEAGTTLEARARYWSDNPPGCAMMLIPAGMRIPPRPVDDYAAIVIADRYRNRDT